MNLTTNRRSYIFTRKFVWIVWNLNIKIFIVNFDFYVPCLNLYLLIVLVLTVAFSFNKFSRMFFKSFITSSKVSSLFSFLSNGRLREVDLIFSSFAKCPLRDFGWAARSNLTYF